jgi:phage repressor protein C with HTH and peptisase S24 domain
VHRSNYSEGYRVVNSQSEVAVYRRSDRLPWVTLGQRITDRLGKLKLSQAELARRVGISQPTINALIHGNNTTSKHLHRIAAELETSPAWLAGETDDDAPVSVALSAIEALTEKLDLAIVPELEIGYSMGGGATIFEQYEQKGVVPFQRAWLRSMMRGTIAELFVARGEGDSMQPTILDGDIVLIDTAQKDIRQQDRIWAVSYGDLGVIKRVRRTPKGTYQLMSDNAAVSTVECADDEMHVVGRVIWIGRRI